MSNVINYVQHSRFLSMNHTLDITAVNKYKHKPSTDDREFKELDFWYNATQITGGIHGHI